MEHCRSAYHCYFYLATALLLLFASCAEDEDRPVFVDNSGYGCVLPENVISCKSGGTIPGVDPRFIFVKGNDGLLSEIRRKTNDGKTTLYVNYSYAPADTVSNAVVTMTIDDGKAVGRTVCTFLIGRNGFANSCVERLLSGTRANHWRFFYDSEGHLVRVDDSGDVCQMTYDMRGNLTRIHNKYNGGDVIRILYTSIPNRGYMPYRDIQSTNVSFGPILSLAYYAGLVGRPSSNLPLVCIAENSYTSRSFRFEYGFDDAGFLNKISMKEQKNNISVE